MTQKTEFSPNCRRSSSSLSRSLGRWRRSVCSFKSKSFFYSTAFILLPSINAHNSINFPTCCPDASFPIRHKRLTNNSVLFFSLNLFHFPHLFSGGNFHHFRGSVSTAEGHRMSECFGIGVKSIFSVLPTPNEALVSRRLQPKAFFWTRRKVSNLTTSLHFKKLLQ